MTATDRHLATSTTTGHTVDLVESSTSIAARKEEVITVRYYRAVVDVFLPTGDGGAWCHTATCTHQHPETDAGLDELRECRSRLARIIDQDKRLPKWATFQ